MTEILCFENLKVASNEEISALLLSKMSHDLASHLNALGLGLEMMTDGVEKGGYENGMGNSYLSQDLVTVQKSYQKILEAFTFYRLLFSQASPEENFTMIMDFIDRKLGQKSDQDEFETKVEDAEKIENTEKARFLCIELRKIILCMFSFFQEQITSFLLKENQNHSIEIQSRLHPGKYEHHVFFAFCRGELQEIPQEPYYVLFLYLQKHLVQKALTMSAEVREQILYVKISSLSNV